MIKLNFTTSAHNLADMVADLHTDAGVPVHDVTMGTAQHSKSRLEERSEEIISVLDALPRVHGMMHDIAYCYRCDTLAIADCQEFVTKGEAWKKGGTMPLNDLKVSELKV